MTAPMPAGRALGAPLRRPRLRADDLRVLLAGTPCRLVPHERTARAGPPTSSCPRPSGSSEPVRAAGGLRARPRRPLHPPHPPPVLGRPRRLPARLVHDEVQPEGGRCRRLAARLRPGPSRLRRRRCTQGWLEVLVELEESLCEITGMAAATLQPAAGAAGELTGLLVDARLPRGQRRVRAPPPGDHPGLGSRHEPGLGDT